MLPDSTSNNKYYIMSSHGRDRTATGIRFLLIFILSMSMSSSSLFCVAQIFSSSSETETQTEDPLLACDPPWRRHGTKCYFTTMTEQERGTLPIAKQTCKRFGGDLGKPSSHDEQTFIRRILMSYNDTWIGATDNERKHWLDGTPMLYTNFDPKDFPTATSTSAPGSSDPSQSSTSTPALCSSSCCGLTTNRDGKWSYSACDTVLNFVCVKTNETVAEYRKSIAKKPKAISNENSHNVPESAPGSEEEEESESGEFSEEDTSAGAGLDARGGVDMESSESKVQSDAVKPEVDSGQKQNQKQQPQKNQQVNPKAGTSGNGVQTPNSSCLTLSAATLVTVSMIFLSILGALGNSQ